MIIGVLALSAYGRKYGGGVNGVCSARHAEHADGFHERHTCDMVILYGVWDSRANTVGLMAIFRIPLL